MSPQRKTIQQLESFDARVESRESLFTHGDGGLAGTRRACHQHGSSSNSALVDHLEDHSSRLASLALSYHALRIASGFESGRIEPEAPDVRVCTFCTSSSARRAARCILDKGGRRTDALNILELSLVLGRDLRSLDSHSL